MVDKPRHLQSVPDMPTDEPAEAPQPDDGIIREVPGYQPPAPDLHVAKEIITEVPPADPNAVPVEMPQYETPEPAASPDEVQDSVDDHPSNIRHLPRNS